jgi:DNA-directed RNA polymerase subunit RPC12/RpoP
MHNARTGTRLKRKCSTVKINHMSHWRFYTCADCGSRQALSTKTRYRSRRLQCQFCGSYYLDPSKAARKEEVARNQRLNDANAIEHKGDRS